MKKIVEAATAGHPDKVCDQIADAIVDEYLKRDKEARVNLSVLGAHGMVMIGGEADSTADFDVSALAKNVYKEAGYQDDIEVFANIEGKDEERTGAKGDTCVVRGYATRETRELLPRAVVFAQSLVRRLDDLRTSDPQFAWLRPDGKAQVLMDRDRIAAVTLLAAHDEGVDPRDVKTALLERVVAPVAGEDGVILYLNPVGKFTRGGFASGTGASGRKAAADTYGGLIPHGDSSLPGKDPRRAARAGAYMARHAARYLVEEGLCEAAFVTAAYAIGRAEPILLEAYGTGTKSRGAKMDFTALVAERFDFRPEAIAERLGLLAPIYRHASTYNQFGRMGLPWEEKAKA